MAHPSPVSAVGRPATRRRPAAAWAAGAALLLAVLGGACSPPAALESAAAPDAAADAARAAAAASAEVWVEATLADLSIEQRIGQLLFPAITGDYQSVDDAGLRDAEQSIRRYHVGGFVVRPAAPTETAAKLNLLQSRARVPLLFAAPAAGPTSFPPGAGLGATGEPGHARVAGRVTAREARAVGIRWLLGPALPGRAATAIAAEHAAADAPLAPFAVAYIRGAAEAATLTTAPAAPGDAAFRLAVLAGADAVLAGSLPPDPILPPPAGRPDAIASAPPLRPPEFHGLVVTDAATALAARPGHAPADLVVRAVLAGADVVLSPPDVEVAHRALLDAVRTGRIAEDRVDASARRILRAKARVDLHHQSTVAVERVARVAGSADHARAAAEIAAASIVLARDEAGVVPLDPRRAGSITLVAFMSDEADETDVAALAFADALRTIYGDVALHRLDEPLRPYHLDQLIRAARASDATIFATFASPDAPALAALPAEFATFYARLVAAAPVTIAVAFGAPHGLAALQPSTLLLGWQAGDAAATAAARAIAGLADISGRSPIELPHLARLAGEARGRLGFDLVHAPPESVGMRSAALARVDAIIEAALLDGAAPGAAIAIGRRGRLVKLRGYGWLDWRDGFELATDSSLYDLASLTKVVATTTLTMMLVDEGLLDLDAPIARFLPEWRPGGGREQVTVRHLLLHNSGLPAYSALYQELRGSDAYVRRIGGLALQYEPGTRTVYSDFGPILLAVILERITGRPLEELLARRIVGPLALRETLFNPLGPHAPDVAAVADDVDDHLPPAVAGLLARIAPTEVDTAFRRDHLHGRVHDENAYALGGVAAHAGLFGSARDLARFAQMLLDGGFFDGRRHIRRSTVLDFTRRQSAASSRALGWDTPTPGSSAGDYFSAASFGHTGFTGTSIWIDPERELFVVLLTNRVNPTRANQKHIELRRAVADAVQRAISDAPPNRRPDS